MNNSIFDIHSLVSEFSPPASIAADMEFMGQGLEKIFAGDSIDMVEFSQRLARILEWAKVRTTNEGNSGAAGWHAKYAGLPGIGGTLTCQNNEQEWMFSVDSANAAYLGSWRSLRPGEEDRGGLFFIEDSPDGKMLVVDTGQEKQRILLPGSEGLRWGKLAGFLQGMQVDEVSQSGAAENQASPPPPPAPAYIPDVKPSPEAAPIIPPKPATRQTPRTPLPSAKSDSKPAPGKQPAVIDPKIWQCACGSKNAGQFCPNCGSEKPAPIGKQKNAPVQPTVCSQCGEVFSIGARFCRNCGAKAPG